MSTPIRYINGFNSLWILEAMQLKIINKQNICNHFMFRFYSLWGSFFRMLQVRITLTSFHAFLQFTIVCTLNLKFSCEIIKSLFNSIDILPSLCFWSSVMWFLSFFFSMLCYIWCKSIQQLIKIHVDKITHNFDMEMSEVVLLFLRIKVNGNPSPYFLWSWWRYYISINQLVLCMGSIKIWA